MIIAGIAHPPARLRERGPLPSLELVCLAVRALQAYPASRLVTSLSPGWELALAKAAFELEIPYRVLVPSLEGRFAWHPRARRLYGELLAGAQETFAAEGQQESGLRPCLEQAETVLALWDYEFGGTLFEQVQAALKRGKTVVNLWREWETLLGLRQERPPLACNRPWGAQVFESRKS